MIVHVVAFDDKPRGERPSFGGEDRPRREFNSDRPRREGGLKTVHVVILMINHVVNVHHLVVKTVHVASLVSDRPRREGGFDPIVQT